MNTAELLNSLADYRRSQSEINRAFTRIFNDGLRDTWKQWDPENDRRHFREMEKVTRKLWGCGSWLHFREWTEEEETTLRNANFCKHHILCRSCAARRAARMVSGYLAKVNQVMESNPDLVPAMVTLTLKNGDDLAERIHTLKASKTAMLARARKSRSGKRRHNFVEWNKVQGSVWSTEVTKKRNGWHPHYHVFSLLDDYIDQAKLSREWHEITGDSFIVGVTKCKNGILPGLIETLKYATKAADLPPADLWDVYRILKGSHLISPHGILRGVKIGDISQDDDSELSGPFRDFVALWSQARAFYSIFDSDEHGLILDSAQKSEYDCAKECRGMLTSAH